MLRNEAILRTKPISPRPPRRTLPRPRLAALLCEKFALELAPRDLDARTDPSAMREQHRRAAAHYRAAKQPQETIYLGLRTNDFETAAHVEDIGNFVFKREAGRKGGAE